MKKFLYSGTLIYILHFSTLLSGYEDIPKIYKVVNSYNNNKIQWYRENLDSFVFYSRPYLIAIPLLKQIATKRVAELIARSTNPSYHVKAFDTLPNELIVPVVQQLIATNKTKSALPILLLNYKLHRQQHTNTNQRKVCLLLANNEQVQLTPEQSKELIQNSVTIRNLIQDIEEQVEEIPLPLLTQEQVITLLSYISSLNALNTSDSTLPMLQQEMPEITALSSYWIKYTALQQLKEHLAAYTVSTLCDLLIAASYLDIENSEQTISFIALATYALGNKLLQSSAYQDAHDVINTLPNIIQRMLVHYLIDHSALRYALCSNSTDVITNTVQTLTGHTGYVNSVSWSPDGKYIASSSNNTIRVWGAQGGTYIRALINHNRSVNSISWSPDGKYMASGSINGIIRIWDATNGTCMHILKGHTKEINSLSWSPDGKQLASSSDDCTIKIWDATNGTCIRTLKGHADAVYSVSWSPDGKYIVSGSWDKTIKTWNANTGNCIHTLTDHTDWVTSVAWSPNSKYITSGSYDKTIKVWDADTDTCISTLRGHTDWISSVSWSPDGKYIASSSSDSTIKIWNITNGTCIRTLKGHADCVRSVSWSPDGSKLAGYSINGKVMVWDIIDKKLDSYLKNTLSWKQVLLLRSIIKRNVLVHNREAQVQQLIEPCD